MKTRVAVTWRPWRHRTFLVPFRVTPTTLVRAGGIKLGVESGSYRSSTERQRGTVQLNQEAIQNPGILATCAWHSKASGDTETESCEKYWTGFRRPDLWAVKLKEARGSQEVSTAERKVRRDTKTRRTGCATAAGFTALLWSSWPAVSSRRLPVSWHFTSGCKLVPWNSYKVVPRARYCKLALAKQIPTLGFVTISTNLTPYAEINLNLLFIQWKIDKCC